MNGEQWTASQERQARRVTRHRPSFFFPLLLIVVGIVFLLENLGVLQGSAWDLILRLWPLLLVVMGLDGLIRRDGFIVPVLFIGVGSLLLLDNLGYLAISALDFILRLWPVLLIAIGFDIIFGRRSIWLSLVGAVIVLAVLAGALWLYQGRVGAAQVGEGEQISQELSGAEAARIVLSPAIASLRVGALEDGDELIAGVIQPGRNQTLDQDISQEGGRIVVRLGVQGGPVIFTGNATRLLWDLGLNPDVPLDLDVDLGVGETDLDLSGLELESLSLDFGVGDASVILPAVGEYQATIDGGIGQIEVILPQGLEARVRVDNGIAAVSLPDELSQNGEIYTTGGYANAENRVDLDVSQGIGNVRIRYR